MKTKETLMNAGMNPEKKKTTRKRRRLITMISCIIVLVLAAAVALTTFMAPNSINASASSVVLTSYNEQNSMPARYDAVNVPAGTVTMTADQYRSDTLGISDGISAFDFHIFADEFTSGVHTCGNIAVNRLKGNQYGSAPEFGSRSNHNLDVERVSYVKSFDNWQTSTHIEDMRMVFGQGISIYQNGQLYAKCGSVERSLGNDNNGSLTGHIYIEGETSYIDISEELQDAENYLRYLVWLQDHTNPDDSSVKVVTFPNDSVFRGSSGSYNVDLSGISEQTIIISLGETDAKSIFRSTVGMTGTVGKRVIINILDEGDAGVKFEDTNMSADKLQNNEESANVDNNILWNFYRMQNGAPESTTGVVELGGTWIGTVNAPEATVECHSGLNGSILGKVVRTYNETHKSDYTGERSKNTEISVTVHKQWKGDNSSVRPSYITLKLYRDGVVYKTQQIDKNNCIVVSPNEWIYTFTNLPAKDGSGNTYQYKVDEVPVDGYNTVVFNNTILNERIDEVPEDEPEPEPVHYTVTVRKLDEDGSPLNGAQLRLEPIFNETDPDKAVSYIVSDEHTSPVLASLSSTISMNDSCEVLTENGKNIGIKYEYLTWTTGSAANVITDLPAGKYRLTEVSAPAGYQTSAPVEFTVNEDGSVSGSSDASVTMTDKRETGSLTLIKYDENDSSIRIAGAQFVLMMKNGMGYDEIMADKADGVYTYVDTVDSGTALVTDENGEITVTGLPWGHDYRFVETAAANGYVFKSKTSVDASLTADKLSDSVSVANTRTADKVLRIRKVDEANEPIAKTEFVVYRRPAGSENGFERINSKTYRTDGSGIIEIDGLEWGYEYKAVETKAADGFVLDPRNCDGVHVMGIDDTIDDATITLVNGRTSAGFAKVEAAGGAAVAGASLTIQRIGDDSADFLFPDTLFAYGADGSVIDSFKNEGGRLEWISGEVAVNIYGIPFGEYAFSETSAPDGYAVQTEPVIFSIGADGGINCNSLDTDGNVMLENERFNGTIIIVKKNENGEPLSGARFKVYKLDGETKLFANADENGGITFAANGGSLFETSDSGRAVVSQLPWGETYYAVEAEAPNGYRISDEVLEFTLTATELSAEKELIDYPDGVTISKRDIYGAEVPGAQLTLEAVNAGASLNEVTWTGADAVLSADAASINWTSTTESLVLSNLPEGGYRLIEKVAPDGYLVTTYISFTVDSHGKVFVGESSAAADGNIVIMTDDATVVRISKTEVGGGQYVADANLTIYDAADNSVVESFDTDGTERVFEHVFVPGKLYKLTETRVPDGYIQAESIYFRLDENGVVYAVPESVLRIEDGEDKTEWGEPVNNNTVIMEDAQNRVEFSKQILGAGAELPGATLTVTDRNGDTFEEFVSGDEPTVFRRRFAANVTYKLTETTAPNGYLKAESMFFYIDENGAVYAVAESDVGADGQAQWVQVKDGVVLMEDKPTEVVISKLDLGAGSELPGAALRVTDEAGVVVTEFVSAEEPTCFKAEFNPGEVYTLTEITAPYGYTIAESMMFTIDDEGRVFAVAEKDYKDDGSTEWGEPVDKNTVVMKDAPRNAVISKQAVGGGSELPGAQLTVKLIKADENGATLEKVTGSLPLEYDSENDSLTWVSGLEANVLSMLPLGEYSLTEKAAPEGYKLAETICFRLCADGSVYSVGVDAYRSDDTTEWGEALENGTVIMLDAPEDAKAPEDDTSPTDVPEDEPEIEPEDEPKDEPKTGSVVFTKRDNFGKSLGGAQFRLVSTGYDETVTSDSKGIVRFDELKPGDYTLTEVKAPKGYIMSTAKIDVTVSENGSAKYKNSTSSLMLAQVENALMNNVEVFVGGENNSMKVGDKIDLKSTLIKEHPEYANLTITWRSSNPDVAAVDGNGKVTMVGSGSTVITAYSNDVPLMTYVLGAYEENTKLEVSSGSSRQDNVAKNQYTGSVNSGNDGRGNVSISTGDRDTTPRTGEGVSRYILIIVAALAVCGGTVCAIITIKRGRKAKNAQ